MVKPGKAAYECTIDSDLDMQRVVGGNIQEYQPFVDPVSLICNEEGKLLSLKPNRALYKQDGSIYDVVYGNFFICGVADEEFVSLSPALVAKYVEKYQEPEFFTEIERGLIVWKR